MFRADDVLMFMLGLAVGGLIASSTINDNLERSTRALDEAVTAQREARGYQTAALTALRQYDPEFMLRGGRRR